MKALKAVLISLLGILLVMAPAVAQAHGGFGWGIGLGLGLGLLTGWAFAPGPVYVAPPVYYSPPPVYRYTPSYYYPNPVYYSNPVPPNPGSPAPGAYGNHATPPEVSSNVPPSGQSVCREWRMVSRQWENRWDSYYGRWRPALVEKWGWAEVPCNK